MQYTLLYFEKPSEFASREDATKSGPYWAAWGAYIASLHKAGIFVNGAGLQPPAMATTVRLQNDKRLVQDGPFADTKEQLGGFVTIDVPNLDAALEWAARSPSASAGCVEVRPVLPPMQ
jgi:hypothetical protein